MAENYLHSIAKISVRYGLSIRFFFDNINVFNKYTYSVAISGVFFVHSLDRQFKTSSISAVTMNKLVKANFGDEAIFMAE